MAIIRQTSFASGELSPYLYGRTDLELFGHGARELTNFCVNRQGNAVSRPGTKLAWTAKSADVVLVPFLLPGATSGYVLEFGAYYVRVYAAVSLALIQELVTPFRAEDLPGLQWAQAGLLLTVTHPSREPQELDFTYPTITINPVRYGPPGETIGAAPLQAVMPSIGGNPPALPVLSPWSPTSLFVLDAAHPPREWQYKVSTLVRNNTTGEVVETLPRDITQYDSGGSVSAVPYVPGVIVDLPADNLLVLFSDAPVYLYPGAGAAVAASANWTPEEYLYYRGRGRLFGLVGSTRSNAFFADFAVEPDYLTSPLRGESPFKAGEYPSAIAYFQQRRVFARSNTWFASAVDEWANFDEPVINWPGQPLRATLLGRLRETAASMVQLQHLFVLTDTSVWQIGRNDVPLDYDTFPSVCRVIDEVGARAMTPLVVGSAILYPVAEGRGVRALRDGGGGNFIGVDVTWHAEHLFRGAHQTSFASMESDHIVSWCYAKQPWSIVWAARADGTLLSMTRTGEDTWAWSKHDTGDNQVISVASVPTRQPAGSASLDDVFLAVKRGGTTYIERMTAFDVRGLPLYATDPLYTGNPIGSTQYAYPLDSYVTATVTKATGTVVTGLGHLEGRDVWGSCPGIDPTGPLRVTGGTVTTPAGWGTTASTHVAAFGLPYTCDLELLDVKPGSPNQKAIVKVGFEVDNASGLQVGEDFDNLVEWQQRTVADAYEYPSAASALVVVTVKGSWRRTGRAVLRQSKPLPVIVLGVTRETSEGG